MAPRTAHPQTAGLTWLGAGRGVHPGDTGHVEHQPHKPGYRVPNNIAWVDGVDFGIAEELYLTLVPDGRTVMLKDTGRIIWLVATESANVVEKVANLVGLPIAEIDEEVNTFLADLMDRGLLVRTGADSFCDYVPERPTPPLGENP